MNTEEFDTIAKTVGAAVGKRPWVLVFVADDGARTASNIAKVEVQEELLRRTADSFRAQAHTVVKEGVIYPDGDPRKR